VAAGSSGGRAPRDRGNESNPLVLTMIHANPARIERGALTIDRKFLSGMARYAHALPAPLATVHPRSQDGDRIMDPVTVPLEELPYRVLTNPRDAQADPGSYAEFEALIRASTLVYGDDFGAWALCRSHRVPYIPVLEYDLRTQLSVTTMEVDQPLRKGWRALRCVAAYLRQVPAMQRAERLHCNGYPVFAETAAFNARRLLYLDSRMSEADVVPAAVLEARLQDRRHAGRPLRLLYSGRYEPMKGALDAVRVAATALDRGLDVELHCYGQGRQRDAMVALAAARGQGRLHVHDPIPYPELVVRSREFDLFVCCHVQSDPSCTYVESLGAGLPIVGYANRMWRQLCVQAQAGRQAPIGDVGAVVAAVAEYAADAGQLATDSRRARQFALDHCFEREFEKRIHDLRETLARLAPTAA
jgi:glycosyltransferase involved in cell wall biosynthesis